MCVSASTYEHVCICMSGSMYIFVYVSYITYKRGFNVCGGSDEEKRGHFE